MKREITENYTYQDLTFILAEELETWVDMRFKGSDELIGAYEIESIITSCLKDVGLRLRIVDQSDNSELMFEQFKNYMSPIHVRVIESKLPSPDEVIKHMKENRPEMYEQVFGEEKWLYRKNKDEQWQDVTTLKSHMPFEVCAQYWINKGHEFIKDLKTKK